MGHYSDVYFGYTAGVADKIEKLFSKTIGQLPEELFDNTIWGQYDSNNISAYGGGYQYPLWQIMSTKRTKWYQSYTPEGFININIQAMEEDPVTYPPEEWFFIIIGESFPADLTDFKYAGQLNESFMEFKVELVDFGTASGSYGFTKSKDREEFEKDMDSLPAHSIGTINYTYIEEYVDYYGLQIRVEPVDEYFS